MRLDLVQQAEGLHRLEVGGRLDWEGAEEHGGVVVGVDDGLPGLHPLGEAVRHHPVEQLLQAGPEPQDVDLHEEFPAVVELLHVSAAEEDADLEARAHQRPRAYCLTPVQHKSDKTTDEQ